MQNIFCCLVSLFMCSMMSAQPVLDFKTKNENNVQERTQMLDLLRNEVRLAFKQEVVFVVEHFKVCGNYAYLEAVAQRKDGKKLVMDTPGADCCRAGALFVKNSGIWQIARDGVFRSDAWNWCIVYDFPMANRAIFSEMALNASAQCE
ncbi:MAG: hypothetical protein ACK5CY_08795 [Bacteroidia bacterium]|jgi:hypothetical protein